MHVVISVGSLHVSIATIAFFKRKTNKKKLLVFLLFVIYEFS